MITKWRDWQPDPDARNIQKAPGSGPTKPTEPGFDGFDGLHPAPCGIFPSEIGPFAVLNSVEARFWIDDESACCIGIWECVDSEDVRKAAARLCPAGKVLHLERQDVPLRFKLMSRRIARIEQARWRTWK